MSAQTVVKWAAILVGSALTVLLASYWIFAPLLGRLNGNRFDKEAGPLAEAEDAAWKTFRETGKFPGVDEKVLGKPGWENALMTGADR